MKPSTGLPMNAEFGTFEDIPPRGDWDRHFEIEGMGYGKRQGWLQVIGQAACGCVWTLQFQVYKGSPSFRQIFDIFGAQFVFKSHTEDHALICEEALPPNITEKVGVQIGTKMSDILAQQP